MFKKTVIIIISFSIGFIFASILFLYMDYQEISNKKIVVDRAWLEKNFLKIQVK